MKNSFKLRNLSIAALVGLVGLGATNSAQANEAPITPTLGDDASYTLTEISTPTDNSITLYKYDNTGITEAINYEVNLKQTEYGTGDTTTYFNWTHDEATGLYIFGETTQDKAQFTVNYDLATKNSRLAVSTDISSTPVVGDFIQLNQTTTQEYSVAKGGAILNASWNGKIGEISGNFVGNYVLSSSYQAKGGAIFNEHNGIDNITGDFIGNYAQGKSATLGGAIYNRGTIGSITGNFIGNYVDAASNEAVGGAILNFQGTIDSITGDFIGNYAKSAYTSTGGAVYMSEGAESPIIKGDFINNSAIADNGMALGGAMYANSSYSSYYGLGIIPGNLTVEGDFIGNRAIQNKGTMYGVNAAGGALAVYGAAPLSEMFVKYFSIEERLNNGATESDFTEEEIQFMESFNANFDKVDQVTPLGMKVVNSDGSTYVAKYVLFGDFLEDRDDVEFPFYAPTEETKQKFAEGWFLFEETKEMSNFTYTYDEVVSMLNELKIHNPDNAEVQNLTVDAFIDKMFSSIFGSYNLPAEYIWTEDPYDVFISSIKEDIKTIDDVRNLDFALKLKNSDLLNNYAEVKIKNGIEAKGGAIYGYHANIKIDADDGSVHLIKGNYTKNGDDIDDNAIYMHGGKLIFDVTNGSTIQLDDNIRGTYKYQTYVIGDESSKFVLNNKIYNSNTHLFDTNLYLVNDNNLDGNNLNLHSGTLNMINNHAGVSALNSLTVTGDTNVNVDVDLKNQTMDRFTASEYGSHNGNLNVTGMNLLSDAVDDTTKILFAENGLKDNVTYAGKELPDSTYQAEVYSPIYKYNVSYDKSGENGYFVFAKPTSGGSGGSESFNPAVLGSSSTATVGALGTMNQTLNYVFGNSDTYMNIPYLERVSMKTRNRYALSLTGNGVDMGRFSPLYQPSQEEASVWVKPYATFETVGLKNGPKVHNNTYGTLIGFDTEMQSLRRGWDRVFTGYIGYNGASQRYSGIDSTQNGGLLGGTMTLYKGNFFNATTVSVGASVANNQTMYGNEDFAMLLSGIGNKTGYNFEFKEGKLILQPSMLMSYTFVNTFDYTNAAGVRIDNKPLHALQLAPGVKVIGNLKGGWQPYASVQMVWNLMGESNATANGVKLPEMSIKPYVQYGVGVQKRIKDHFTAYGQAMVQNGGRNGVSLTAGFRWALGHDNCKYEKTQRHPEVKTEGSLTSKEILRSAQNDGGKYIDNKTSSLDVGGVMPRAAEHRKILKQMTPEQKMAHGGKYYNTSRTAKTGSLRQY